MKKFVFIALLGMLFSTSCLAEQEGRGLIATTDLFVFRPVTLASTIAGGALWLVGLPFTLPTKSQGKAFNVMVKTPYQWTFERPLAEPSN
jgi:hypothetical protein